MAESTYFFAESMCAHAAVLKQMEYPQKELNAALKDILSASVIQKAWEPVYEKLGESRDKSSCTIKANGDYATVVLISNYANGKLQVTATYNTDMELIGLYIK